MSRAAEYWLWMGTAAGVLLLLRTFTRGGIVVGGRAPSRSQSYGYQRTPTHIHRGVDIMAPRNSPVLSAGPGIVAAVWPDGRVSGYGNTVVVQHPDGSQTLYAHLEAFAPGIARGARVTRLQPLGTVGTTQAPRSPMQTGPHLHFEAHRRHDLAIREENPPRFDPLAYLAARNLGVAA